MAKAGYDMTSSFESADVESAQEQDDAILEEQSVEE